jgi:hypothetical protein
MSGSSETCTHLKTFSTLPSASVRFRTVAAGSVLGRMGASFQLTFDKDQIAGVHVGHDVLGVLAEVKDGEPVGVADGVWSISPVLDNTVERVRVLAGAPRAIIERKDSLPSSPRTSSGQSSALLPLSKTSTHVLARPSWAASVRPACTASTSSPRRPTWSSRWVRPRAGLR